MLVLTRRIGEEIVIADSIRVTVVAIQEGRVRLGVTAPDSVRVDRQEIHERRSQADESIPPTKRTDRPDSSPKLPLREK
jgi:carbon storage regulator